MFWKKKKKAPKSVEKSTKENVSKISEMREPKSLRIEDFELLRIVARSYSGKHLEVAKKDDGQVLYLRIISKSSIENFASILQKLEERSMNKMEHPFLINLRYSFQNQTEDKLYMLSDFAMGGELFFHLQKARKFDEDTTRFYAAQIASVLSYIHTHNIIYEDLKPENMLLDFQGYIRLTLPVKAERLRGGSGSFCGTPEYLAPEVMLAHPLSKAVDWWSYGIIVYEMLVGLPPFYSEDIQKMYQMMLKGEIKFPNDVSPEARSLIARFLDRDPLQRLGSGENDWNEIQNHPFFRGINWDQLLKRQLCPPMLPLQIVWDNDGNVYYCNHGTIYKLERNSSKLYLFASEIKNVNTVNFGGASQAIAFDKDGNMYAGTGSTVQFFNTKTKTVETIAGSNNSGYKNGPCNTAQFCDIKGIAVDDNGTVYVSESVCIRRIQNGEVSTVAGSTKGHKDGPFSEALFSKPEALVLHNHYLLVHEADTHCVRKLDLKLQKVFTVVVQENARTLTMAPDRTCILFGTEVLALPGDLWSRIRLLWIGWMKEDRSCLLTLLPKELITEIALLVAPPQKKRKNPIVPPEREVALENFQYNPANPFEGFTFATNT